MRRKKIFLAAVLMLALALTACSAAGRGALPADGIAPEAPNNAAIEHDEMHFYGGGGDMMSVSAPIPSPAPEGGPDVRKESKLILEAALTLQTTDFSTSETALAQLVEQSGGYFERAQVQGGGVYDANAARYGSYTVRVPADQFEDFLNLSGDVGYVVSRSRSATDVGEHYADAQSHLRAQEIKRERLLGLLEKAATMEDIISLENALSDTEYQIEQYTGTLKQYDALVDYATIQLELSEVRKLSDEPGEADSLGTRIAAAFSGGAASFGEGLCNCAVWCAYHFVGILICAALAAAAALAAVRIHKKKHRLPPPAPPTEQP